MSNSIGNNMPGGVQSPEAGQTPAGSAQPQDASSEDADHFANLMASGGSQSNVAGASGQTPGQDIMEQLQQLFNQQQTAGQLPDLSSLPALVGGPAQPGSTGPAPGEDIMELLQQLSDQQQAAGAAGPAQPGSNGPAPGQNPTEYLEQLFQQQQAAQAQNGGDE
ncbi:MAG: hypothetical protein AAGC95_01505 [Pseudomonadota bacterium]